MIDTTPPLRRDTFLAVSRKIVSASGYVIGVCSTLRCIHENSASTINIGSEIICENAVINYYCTLVINSGNEPCAEGPVMLHFYDSSLK